MRRVTRERQQGLDLCVVEGFDAGLRCELVDPGGVEVVVGHGPDATSGAVDPTLAPDDTAPAQVPARPAAVVLAGGRSSRFGADKTQATFAGVTVLERVLGAVEPLGRSGRLDEVLVVGTWAPDGVRLELEAERHLGPLGGLAHGLAVTGSELVLVLAGDHPLLVPGLLELLIDRAEAEPSADAVVPVGPDGPEPLVACYRRRVLGVASSLLTRDRRSVRGLLDELSVEWIGRRVWSRVDPAGVSFRDIDTPEDLAALEPPPRH